jgi:hypothetical protein
VAGHDSADSIRPGVEACMNDADIQVIELANEILGLLDQLQAD